MADDADRSVDIEEQLTRAAVGVRKETGPTPNGFCHWCDAAVKKDQRWCDKDCRDDWEQHERFKKINGRPDYD